MNPIENPFQKTQTGVVLYEFELNFQICLVTLITCLRLWCNMKCFAYVVTGVERNWGIDQGKTSQDASFIINWHNVKNWLI